MKFCEHLLSHVQLNDDAVTIGENVVDLAYFVLFFLISLDIRFNIFDILWPSILKIVCHEYQLAVLFSLMSNFDELVI